MSKKKEVSIAFAPDKLVDAKRDFRGIVVDAEYALEPFGFKGRPDRYTVSEIMESAWEDGYGNGYFTGYMECAIDGEGSISVTRGKPRNPGYDYLYSVKVVVWNTRIEFLERIRDMVGYGSINSIKVRGNRKPCWYYYMPRDDVRRILPNLRLVVKERQRQLVLELLDMVRPGRGGRVDPHTPQERKRLEQIWMEVKRLNLGLETDGGDANLYAQDIERREQMAIKIRTEEYEKDQIVWFPPSDKKLTKSAQAGMSLFRDDPQGIAID